MASPVAGVVGRRLDIGLQPTTIQRVTNGGAEDGWMSRDHATVRRGGGGLLVQDGVERDGGWKHSANGTFARGEPVADEVRVGLGDTVRTGHSLWVVAQNATSLPHDTLLVGVSSAVGAARDEIDLVVSQVAVRLERKQRVTQSLLVTGPRGTGKQVVAREARRLLGLARQSESVPFRQVSAPSLADGTAAADLFGVVDRYATGVKGRTGFFAQADGGVLLLDEVGDTPLAEQAKLLNVLQEREVTPLGATRSVPFDCLVVGATNQDLGRLSEEGSFRADLLDRLGRFRIHLPPLDERKVDLPFIGQALLTRHGYQQPLPWDVVEVLLSRGWPGNVRELDVACERMVAVAARWHTTIDREVFDEALRGLDVPMSSSTADVAAPAAGPRGRPTHDELYARMQAHDWNKSAVARLYGKHPRQITRWMEYLGIERPDS